MKGGTYEVITEANGTKRFSRGSDVRDGAVHNENGARDVQLIRSLHPGQDDNHIIQHSIGDDNTYGWLRNLSDKSTQSSEETPVEEQFRSLNTRQQNDAIDATKDAINTRLNDSNFPFKWISSDSEEYRRAVESGRNIQRWKLKDDHSGSGNVDEARGHKLAIAQLRQTLGNFRSIQNDITAEQERQEEERHRQEEEERRQEREEELQASQAAIKKAEQQRNLKKAGLKKINLEIKDNYHTPLSSIVEYQQVLKKLTNKQKLEKARLNLQINIQKMQVKRYYDSLQSDSNVTSASSKNRERNEMFQAHIDDLSPEHRDLHNSIIKTTNKQFEGTMKTLESNLNKLSQAKQISSKARNTKKAENKLLEREMEKAKKEREEFEKKQKIQEEQKRKQEEQKRKQAQEKRKQIQQKGLIMMRFVNSINHLDEVIIPLYDKVKDDCTNGEIRELEDLYSQASAIADKKGPVTHQDVAELDSIITKFYKKIPKGEVLKERVKKSVMYHKLLDTSINFTDNVIVPNQEKGVFSEEENQRIKGVQTAIITFAREKADDLPAATQDDIKHLMKLVYEDLIKNTNAILDSKMKGLPSGVALERVKSAGKTRRKKRYKTKTKKHKKKKYKTKRARKYQKKRKTKRR